MAQIRGLASLVLFTVSALAFPEVGVASSDSSPDSVKIVSISPDPGTALRVGGKVSLKVEVEYNLGSAASGSITLVVQQGDSGKRPLANETEVVQKGKGRLVFRKEIEVPETSAIQVFTPLSVQGGTSTSVVDTRIYKVVKN